MMKKHIARFVMIFSLILGATLLVGSTTEAADYEVTTIEAKGVGKTRGASDVRINKDGQLQYYTFYDLSKSNVFKKVTYDDKKTKSEKIFKRSQIDEYYPLIKQDGDKKLWLVHRKKNTCYYIKCNNKGKILNDIKIKIKGNYGFSICDIMSDGNKLYCVLDCYAPKNKSFIEILCINKKNSKIISKKRIPVQKEYLLKFANNKIYAMDFYGNDIDVFSLKGKKLATYQLPEGLKYKGYEEYNFNEFTVKNNSIYYINANGVFKCDELGTKKFELIYDASNDEIFTKFDLSKSFVSVKEIYVKNDNEFYVIFNDEAGYESYAPTAVARYTKKN